MSTQDKSQLRYMTLVEYIELHGLEMPDHETLEAMERRATELSQAAGVPVYTRPILDPGFDPEE